MLFVLENMADRKGSQRQSSNKTRRDEIRPEVRTQDRRLGQAGRDSTYYDDPGGTWTGAGQMGHAETRVSKQLCMGPRNGG